MEYKHSPYNKTSAKSKAIMTFFKLIPHARVRVIAKIFGRSIPNVEYLRGESNGNY